MNPIRCLARLLLFLALSIFARAADLPRVAVVSDSPEPSLAAFADFLSVSLAAASTQYALVERAELTRLASEAEVQKLAPDQRPVALAKLAKADGLIIVGMDKGDPKLPKLTLRLTSTNNGLVLRSLILSGKEDEYPKVAELAAGILRFPCERLTNRDAKPPIIVSLLGIRPAFEIDRALETTLNLAVAQQLSAQSGIAVSERWKMNDLVFERSLADEKPQPFATGTVLLDGSYTRKGDEMEITLRLRNAESENGKKLVIKGPATKPADIAQQIAKLVATESGQSGEAVAWNALEEAKQYSNLGGWLRQRNQGKQSAQAYETALALGLGDVFVLRARVWAYQSILGEVGSYTVARKDVDGWDRLPKHEFKEKLMTAIRMTQVAIEALDVKWGGATQQEYANNDRNFILVQTFDFNMQALQALCMRREQLELATEARTLRALSRELLAKSEAELQNSFAGDFVQRFYMHDTPEEAAVDLRSLLDLKKLGDEHWSKGSGLRSKFWLTCGEPSLQRFVDWSSTDNRAGEAAWKQFIGELKNSKLLLNRLDGLAFAFQSSHGKTENEEILRSVCDLLDANWELLLTPEGQMSFYSFTYFYRNSANHAQYLEFNQWLASCITRIFESGQWVGRATIFMASSAITDWGKETADGTPLVPDSLALPLLIAVENYIQWAKADPRWKQHYQPSDHKPVENYLERLPGEIILAYPKLKEQRIKARPVVAGAPPIRAWKPEGPGLSDSKNWLFGEVMISSGDSLFVPMINQGVIELNTHTMAVKRVMALPLPGFNFIGGISHNRKSMIMNMKDRMFTCPLDGDGKSWTELLTPGVTKEDSLTWCVRGFDDEFFVGSCITRFEVKSPRMLAGIARDGKLTWLASSDRRPALNPLDEMNPRSTLLAYRNAAGKTMILMTQSNGRTPLIELESGKEVSSVATSGVAQMRGEIPLYWNATREEGIACLLAFDPAREQPCLVFKSNKGAEDLPEIWKDVNPLYDAAKPEFRGAFVAAVAHGGYLWLLRRELEEPQKFEKNDPNAFRLVRVGLDGSEVLTVPLRYEVPEEIRKLPKTGQQKEQASLDRPVINVRSLTATTKGLFFASSGNGGLTWSGARAIGGDLVPVLLYVTWEDIQAWLAKNGK